MDGQWPHFNLYRHNSVIFSNVASSDIFCLCVNSSYIHPKGSFKSHSTECLWLCKYGFIMYALTDCQTVTKFVMEGRKRTGLAWEDSGEIYSDKLKQLRTLRALKTSTLSFVSAITLSIRFGCLPLTDRAPESSLRLSPRVPTPRWLY